LWKRAKQCLCIEYEEAPNHKEAYQRCEQEESDRKKGESSMKRKDSTLVSQMTLEKVIKKNCILKIQRNSWVSQKS